MLGRSYLIVLFVVILALLWLQVESIFALAEVNDVALAIVRVSQGRDLSAIICEPTRGFGGREQSEVGVLVTRLQAHEDSDKWRSARVANLLLAAMQLEPVLYQHDIPKMAPLANELGGFRLGLARFLSGDLNGAAQIWDVLGAANYPLGAGNVCRNQGRDDVAATWYQLAAKMDSVRGRALFALGLLEYDKGKFDKAAIQFCGALERGYQTPEAYLYAGAALVKVGRANDAMSILTQGIEKYPMLTDLWLWYAESAYLVGQVDKSLRSYRQTLELDPDNSYGHLGLAKIYLREGDPRALDQVRAVLDLNSKAVSKEICNSLKSLSVLLVDSDLNERIYQECEGN